MSELIERRGGRRAGAGRPKKPRSPAYWRTAEGETEHEWHGDVPHRVRPSLSPDTPVHVTLRSPHRDGFRGDAMHAAAIHAVERSQSATFRIAHLSIQHNHLHLIVEAASRRYLSRGMQGFTIRLVKRFHALEYGSSGQVFPRRYHAVQLKTPLQVYRALSYVLNNWRHHWHDREEPTAKLDRYSSATRFRGWVENYAWELPSDYTEMPVEEARTPLLRERWKRHGLIDPWHVPGGVRRHWR